MSPEAKGQTIGKDAKDMQELKLTVSSSPHVRCNETVPKIMWSVVAALVPAAAFGVYYFGVNALVNIVVAIVSAVVFEFLWEKGMHRKVTIKDGSAVITGLLLAMCCPPSLPWWMSIIGSYNLDMRSTYQDTELMLVIDSQEVNQQLREEMQKYEEEALKVLDAERYQIPEGVTPRELTPEKEFRINFLEKVAGWARFLM